MFVIESDVKLSRKKQKIVSDDINPNLLMVMVNEK